MGQKVVEIEFAKLSGAGNDFIVIDNLDGKLPVAGRRELFQRWCRRGMSVGADGVLLVEPAEPAGAANFRMRYYNADGGEAETCGNGSRCIARFAYVRSLAPKTMTFQTLAGDYQAEVLDNGHVRLKMSDAFGLELGKHRIEAPAGGGEVDFVNTGVPHAIVFYDSVDSAPVVDLGRKLRHEAAFAPAGTNVNFVQVTGPQSLRVRTYERGVEDETLACGTGCIASAVIAVARGRVQAPVAITTASGELLNVGFELNQDRTGATNVSLEGSAVIVFRGWIEV
jgi:diaminopimelate epimerase